MIRESGRDRIVIRQAEPADARAIARVHVATWRTAYRGQMPDDFLARLSVDERTERWTRTIPLETVGTFVAENRGEIVGFVSAGAARESDSDRTGDVYSLYVLKRLAGQGIGSALLTEAEAWLRERGRVDARLWVLATNDRARAFYAARGWRDDGIEQEEVVLGARVREVRYSKQLGERMG